MSKQLVIPCSRMVLVLNESDLINGLRPEALEKGIKQGKGYRRAAESERRQEPVDRWRLYEWLKGNHLDGDITGMVETMSARELREGVMEYLSTKIHN